MQPLRIAIIGMSGCGKTTLAQQLGEYYGLERLQIDSMYWEENWTLREGEDFFELVEVTTTADCWVIDGNGAHAKTMIWERATHILWLNYSFTRVFTQLLRRTIRRVWTKEVIFSGNQESFRRSFLSQESILWFMISNFYKKRAEFQEYFDLHPEISKKVIEINSPIPQKELLNRIQVHC